MERNIAEDESALNELQELGIFSTPATVINGAVVIGFDRNKLEKLLGLTGAKQGIFDLGKESKRGAELCQACLNPFSSEEH